MKPREWWIAQHELEDFIIDSHPTLPIGNQDAWIHVIEKSAYDRLEAMTEKLAEALDFYSKFTSYNETEIDGEPRIPVYWEDMSGRRARLALIEYRAMRDETKMPCPDKDIDPFG